MTSTSLSRINPDPSIYASSRYHVNSHEIPWTTYCKPYIPEPTDGHSRGLPSHRLLVCYLKSHLSILVLSLPDPRNDLFPFSLLHSHNGRRCRFHLLLARFLFRLIFCQLSYDARAACRVDRDNVEILDREDRPGCGGSELGSYPDKGGCGQGVAVDTSVSSVGYVNDGGNTVNTKGRQGRQGRDQLTQSRRLLLNPK